MSRWYVSEQSIYDEDTCEEIVEASDWYMKSNLRKICDEHNNKSQMVEEIVYAIFDGKIELDDPSKTIEQINEFLKEGND